MGFLIVTVAVVLLVPFVIFVFTRRPSAGINERGTKGKSITFAEPASDQPTPGDATVNAASAEASRRMPPG